MRVRSKEHQASCHWKPFRLLTSFVSESLFGTGSASSIACAFFLALHVFLGNGPLTDSLGIVCDYFHIMKNYSEQVTDAVRRRTGRPFWTGSLQTTTLRRSQASSSTEDMTDCLRHTWTNPLRTNRSPSVLFLQWTLNSYPS